MFDHAGFDVRDLKKSMAFYDAALAALGVKRLVFMEEYAVAGYGREGERPKFWVAEGAPTNGDDDVHLCFSAKTRAEVDAFHAAALRAGGRDNGAPGLRPIYHANYYGGFVLDPDGNGMEACCHSPA
ncbi:MAG: VOC family protein [Bdellovibrionales bacterium]|nr:VOC family protein [Bdellovibrionales bacterium]